MQHHNMVQEITDTTPRLRIYTILTVSRSSLIIEGSRDRFRMVYARRNSYCFGRTHGEGNWKTEKGAKPFEGIVGKIT